MEVEEGYEVKNTHHLVLDDLDPRSKDLLIW